jgi:hypothetical protein
MGLAPDGPLVLAANWVPADPAPAVPDGVPDDELEGAADDWAGGCEASDGAAPPDDGEVPPPAAARVRLEAEPPGGDNDPPDEDEPAAEGAAVGTGLLLLLGTPEAPAPEVVGEVTGAEEPDVVSEPSDGWENTTRSSRLVGRMATARDPSATSDDTLNTYVLPPLDGPAETWVRQL